MEQPDPERVAIEAKVAFLERSVEVMNEVLIEQSRSIQELVERLAVLERELSGDEGEDIAPHDTPPPHY
ncbi:MAG: SlyX family protein [Planctomycetota bacterium]|nr:SlyX family protein [Planctomycetota bacterium]